MGHTKVLKEAKTVVIKIGSSTIIDNESGKINDAWMSNLAKAISRWRPSKPPPPQAIRNSPLPTRISSRRSIFPSAWYCSRRRILRSHGDAIISV